MIIEPPFAEEYQQERQIQKQIGDSWGYRLSNSQYTLPKNQSELRDAVPKINVSMNPLKVKSTLLEPSQRLKQLNQEMRVLEMQKKMSKDAQDSDSFQLDIVELLNKKIREYNYIVDHYHITKAQEDPQIEDLVQKKENKPETQLIAHDIETKKVAFLHCRGRLSEKERRSRQIVHLYHHFSKKIIEPKSSSPKTHQSQKIEKKKPEPENIKTQRFRLHRSMAASPLSARKDINLKEPYAPHRYFQAHKKVQKEIKNGQHSLQVWEHRLKQISQNPNFDKQVSESIKNRSGSLDETRLDSQLLSELPSFEYKEEPGNEQQQKNKKNQETILSMHLQKRNSRYRRQAGNKFVSKFDSFQLAKSMLEGLSVIKEKKELLPVGLKQMYRRNLRVPKDLPQRDKEVMNLMIQQEDDMFYWTASRNEKINLLLKGRKHG